MKIRAKPYTRTHRLAPGTVQRPHCPADAALLSLWAGQLWHLLVHLVNCSQQPRERDWNYNEVSFNPKIWFCFNNYVSLISGSPESQNQITLFLNSINAFICCCHIKQCVTSNKRKTQCRKRLYLNFTLNKKSICINTIDSFLFLNRTLQLFLNFNWFVKRLALKTHTQKALYCKITWALYGRWPSFKFVTTINCSLWWGVCYLRCRKDQQSSLGLCHKIFTRKCYSFLARLLQEKLILLVRARIIFFVFFFINFDLFITEDLMVLKTLVWTNRSLH